MRVEYLEHMGNDLTVCDVARVSFDKIAANYTLEQNHRLIHYLAKHQHWSPFSHPTIRLRITAPVFVAAQLKRSTVGLAINEVSRRYVDDEPTFYIPDKWRGRPEGSIKQGSSEEEITETIPMIYVNSYGTITETTCVKENYRAHIEGCRDMYAALINAGIAPEQARMVLPQSMNTSWIWTGSLLAFIRIYKQRIDKHSQLECQMIAEQIGEILKEHFPVSFEAWTGGDV